MDETSSKAKPWQIQPGQVLNPVGRPMGSRQRLGEKFIATLAADFEVHGADTVRRLREEHPDRYAQIIANVMPKALEVAIQHQSLGGLDATAYSALRSLLDVIQHVGIEGEPQQVFEMIEEDLRARLARPISDGQ
jgi:hypothetical protein